MPPKAPVNKGKQFPQKRPDGTYLHRYGLVRPMPVSEWVHELGCWQERASSGLPPVEHLKRAIQLLQPDSVWHPWREQRFDELCNDESAVRIGKITIRNVSWVGVGAGGKTNDAAVFAFHYWLAAPNRTAVVLTSTSKTKMRQRAWPVIQECWINAKTAMEEAGISGPHMVNSMMVLKSTKADEKHAIFGQAIEAGEVQKAIENLKGVHAERMLLVIDEAIATPEAVYRLIPNMLKGCKEFILLNLSNGPPTHLDCFSKVCTPVGGWKSITVDSDRWETRPVPEFQLPRGICLHFDGTKSPNVVAGKTLYPFLYTWENWLHVRDNATIQRTAEFWSQDRGFWPPEGFVNTVLTEELIEIGNARGQVAFEGRTTPVGSLDSGFGGDNCVLRFGRLGRISGAKRAIQIDERIIIPILVDEIDPETGKKVPAEYQIARRVMTEAKARGVHPEFFGVEATGTGRGVAAVLTQEWGEVIWVESGGAPTDMPASEEDQRQAKEIYDRKITELWFSVQAFVKGGQLGGLCEDDVIQFCSRTYEFVGKKYKIERKEDLKARLGRSPDEADSVAVMCHVARLHGLETRGPRGDRMLGQWDREIKRQQSVYAPELMYAPEEKV